LYASILPRYEDILVICWNSSVTIACYLYFSIKLLMSLCIKLNCTSRQVAEQQLLIIIIKTKLLLLQTNYEWVKII